MQNDRRVVQQNTVLIVLNIVIAILCVLVVLLGLNTLKNVYEDNAIPHSERQIESAVMRGDFYRLVDFYHQNTAAGFEGNRNMKEYYGVAKYFEAASLYKAFSEAGDTARAEGEKAKMEQALTEMGDWSVLEEDINDDLGL